jgi:hypothetical protein
MSHRLEDVPVEQFTGARPFPGPDEASFRLQHQQVPPPQPAGVPAAVARLMLRLLAKDPAERP